jgi:hypothetical protein
MQLAVDGSRRFFGPGGAKAEDWLRADVRLVKVLGRKWTLQEDLAGLIVA